MLVKGRRNYPGINPDRLWCWPVVYCGKLSGKVQAEFFSNFRGPNVLITLSFA